MCGTCNLDIQGFPLHANPLQAHILTISKKNRSKKYRFVTDTHCLDLSLYIPMWITIGWGLLQGCNWRRVTCLSHSYPSSADLPSTAEGTCNQHAQTPYQQINCKSRLPPRICGQTQPHQLITTLPILSTNKTTAR